MNNKGINLIIGGVHKAGTTSLYTYLSWHPNVLGSEIKETHFFSGDNYKSRYEDYESYFKKYKDEKYKLKASPEYIYERSIAINNIKAYTKSPKLIFVFRNPTDKIVSSFNHRKKNVLFDNPNYTFEEFKKEYLSIKSLDVIEKEDSIYTKELLDGSYIDYIKDWYDNYKKESIKIIFFDDLKNDPKKVVENLCNWLEIDSKFYNDKSFNVENKSVDFKSKTAQKLISKVYTKFEPVFRNNYKLKNILRKLYYSINVNNTKSEIKQEVIKEIDSLYKIKNIKLKEFLKEQGYTDFPQWL